MDADRNLAVHRDLARTTGVDRVFSMPEAIGLIRLQLADGTWKAGPFDGDSYASNMQETRTFTWPIRSS